MDLETVGRRGNAIIVAVSFDDKGEAVWPRLDFMIQPIYIAVCIGYTSCT